MKLLRIVLGLFLLALLGVWGIGLLRPATWSVTRSTTLATEPARVHAWLDDLEHWPAFLADPAAASAIEWSYGPRRSGAGATLTGRTTSGEGAWTLRIVRSSPDTGIEYETEFEGGAHPVRGVLRGEPLSSPGAEQGTRVTLHEEGSVGFGPVERWLRGVIERGYARQVDERLARLAAGLARASDEPRAAR